MARLHVRPLPGGDGGLSGAAGAYANVLALACSREEFTRMVVAEMHTLGLAVVEVDGAEPYHAEAEDDEAVVACAERLSDEWPVQYHSFQTYAHDDA